MACAVLDTSPLASRLLELAARRASGRLTAGARTLLLSNGDLTEILPAPEDESVEQFLVKSGRLSEATLASHARAAAEKRCDLPELLIAEGALGKGELHKVRRAMLLDRLSRALQAAEQGVASGEFVDGKAAAAALTVPLVPLLLDALARRSASEDAAVVGTHLNHRIEWLQGAHEATARAWADLGDVPQQPAVSTVLAKRPAAAPRLSALLRAGVIRLLPPGRTVPSEPPRASSLPAPPPRDFALDSRPVESSAPRQAVDPLSAIRAPELQLDPGSAYLHAEPLEPTSLPKLPPPDVVLDDPLLAIEQRIEELEASSASGTERARAFVALAEGFRERFLSLERACRCLREAAAADPGLPHVLEQAALHCDQLGQRDLAVRYVTAAVGASGIPIERAAAQRLRAAIARSAGDVETCIEALCEAAADDPTSSAAHEQVAALLLERGQLDGGNAHARLAATCVQDDAPERALCLLAHAFTLTPHDAATAYEYASLLDASGRRMTAVAVLAHAAARNEGPAERRKLRLSAVERAEAAGRPDVAAELLVDAFDEAPEFDLVYGPLDDDLRAVEPPEYRAVVLEDVATVCPDEQRAHWLTRAAEAQRAAGQHEAGSWLLFEAVLLDPREPARIEALRAHAESRRELLLLAHGLRAAIAARLEAPKDAEARAEARRLLRELASLARTGLDNPHLALAACEQLRRISEPDPELDRAIAALAQAIEIRRVELARCERALAAAAEGARPALCLKVAALLPDLPEHWSRAIQLLSEALAGGVEVEHTREALETLYGVSRDAAALAAFLEDQAELCPDAEERVRLLARLAAVHTVREDARAVAAACESLLALDPGCGIAIARLERAARKLSDRERLLRALSLRCKAARSPRARARALARLAHAEEGLGLPGEAAGHAVDALSEDPSAADAALLLVRHAKRLVPEVARFGLRAAAPLCGPSRAVLAAQVEAARALSDAQGERAALDAWTALLPSDAQAHEARLRYFAARGEAEPLLEAAETALDAIPSQEVAAAALDALGRLEQLEAFEPAARLALRLAGLRGALDPELVARALAAARSCEVAELVTRALELRVAMAKETERAERLCELADHHARQGDVAAEIRALWRALEPDPKRPELLARLRALLAGVADGRRLARVIDLELEHERDPGARRQLHLLGAAVHGVLLGERERVERHVRALVAERAGEPALVREALGVLFAVSSASWALARAEAIAEHCPPELGSRIYQWCAATAEQRLGDRRLAIEVARRGALRFPSQAELLLIVERLTLASEDADTALEVYGALIAASVGPHGRRALLYRAGRWLERAGLEEPALERYLQAFALSPSTGAAFKAIVRLSRQTGQLHKVLPCYAELVEQASDGRTRAALLCAASELCVRELGDLREGFALLARANAATEHHELDDRVLELARRLRSEDPEAGAAAFAALVAELETRAAELWNADDRARCLSRLARIQARELAAPEAARARLAEAERLAAEEELAEAAREELAAVRAELDALCAEDARARPAAEIRDAEALDEAPAQPEAPVVPQPAGVLAETPGDARARLHRVLEAEPFRTDALRELHALCARHGPEPERHVLAHLLAAFDPNVKAPPAPAFHPGLWRGRSLRNTIGTDLPPELARFLSNLWDYARVTSRLRRSLASFGIAERDRISRITVGPVAEAYAQAARMLDATDVPVYVALQDSSPARALPTHPPAVVAGRGVAQDPSALLYSMAHALWLAHPERIVLGVLSDDEAASLLEGARLAFAPALARKGVGQVEKEIAAALWQSVPTREQRVIADVLTRCQHELEGSAVRAEIRATAARAALLVSGALGYALTRLPRTEPELDGHELEGDAAFAEACRASPALAATVRCALSEPFQAALAQVL